MLKKTTLSILGLLFSGIAFSGTMGSVCTPANVSLPCASKKWDLGIQALYLKPLYGSARNFAPVINAAALLQGIEPEWDWGYRLEGSYHFDTGIDITANWSHFDADSNPGTYNGSFFLSLTPLLTAASNYQLLLDNRYDQVNVVMGQQVDMGMRKKARFYGGLQYADIHANEFSLYNVTNPVILRSTGGISDSLYTDFNGIGPVLGIDYSYDLISGFSITANTAGSLLYGASRFNFASSFGNGLVVATLYNTKHLVVPSLEAKLGANYACSLVRGVLNLQGGYQAVNYFNAIQGRPLVTAGLASSNFGMFGPYFGAQWLAGA